MAQNIRRNVHNLLWLLLRLCRLLMVEGSWGKRGCFLGLTIYRAEDCAAALSILKDMLLAWASGHDFKPCKHWHLWEPILTHLLLRPANVVTPFKVDSLQNWQIIPDPFLRWCGQWNDFADLAAKRVIRVQREPLYSQLCQL